MKRLWAIAAITLFFGLAPRARAGQAAPANAGQPSANSRGNFGQPRTYPDRPIINNRTTGHHGNPTYNGSGFGPNYNPNGMSGLNANGNTGVASGPGLGTVTPGWRVRKNQ